MNAMLRRQQANAVIAARSRIVEFLLRRALAASGRLPERRGPERDTTTRNPR